MTPLMVAAEKGHIDAVTFIIEQGADVSLQDSFCKTAVHYAVLGSDAPCEILSCWIENGADVNAGCRLDDQTPLMFAAENGHINAVTFPLNMELMSVFKTNVVKQTFTMPSMVLMPRACEILSCLIENGGDVNAGCRYDNQTPLMITAGKPH